MDVEHFSENMGYMYDKSPYKRPADFKELIDSYVTAFRTALSKKHLFPWYEWVLNFSDQMYRLSDILKHVDNEVIDEWFSMPNAEADLSVLFNNSSLAEFRQIASAAARNLETVTAEFNEALGEVKKNLQLSVMDGTFTAEYDIYLPYGKLIVGDGDTNHLINFRKENIGSEDEYFDMRRLDSGSVPLLYKQIDMQQVETVLVAMGMSGYPLKECALPLICAQYTTVLCAQECSSF